MAWVTFDRLLQNYSISFRIENAHQSQNNLKLAVTGRSRYVTQFCRISALIILKLAALTGCYSSGSMPVDVISVLNVFYDAAFTSLQSEFAGYFVLNLPITLCPSALPTKRSILLLPSSASTLPVPNLFPQNNIQIKYINPSQHETNRWFECYKSRTEFYFVGFTMCEVWGSCFKPYIRSRHRHPIFTLVHAKIAN